MASKLYNKVTEDYGIIVGSDTVGNYLRYENGIKEYSLTMAITHNVTLTDAADGSWARTTNATGRGKWFISDGDVWKDINV